MSVTPPVGFGLVAYTFETTGAARSEVCVIGFQNVNDQTALNCLAAVAVGLGNTGRPFHAAQYSSLTSVTKRYCLVNRVTAGLQSYVDLTATAGTQTWDAPPPNVSVVVNKTSANAGRRFRGRVAMPSAFLDETAVNSAGIIGGSRVTAIQACWTSALADLTTGHVPMFLLHAPGISVVPAPTAVTGLTVSNMVGTQRRRMRR